MDTKTEARGITRWELGDTHTEEGGKEELVWWWWGRGCREV